MMSFYLFEEYNEYFENILYYNLPRDTMYT